MRATEFQRQFVIGTALLLAVLVTAASLIGIYTADFYARESENWQLQALGQDVIDLLLIVPFLTVSAVFTYFNRKIGLSLWCGALLYLIYTFTIYAFSIHFNSLFILYCLILGISFYAFLFIVYKQAKERIPWVITSTRLTNTIAVYFLLIAVVFYALWLSDIISAIGQGVLPQSLQEASLVTNPVHVLDLAVLLPGLFITGILLLRKNHLGIMLTPVLLSFFVLMDCTIAILALILRQTNSAYLAIGMFVLASISVVLLILYFKKLAIREKDN